MAPRPGTVSIRSKVTLAQRAASGSTLMRLTTQPFLYGRPARPRPDDVAAVPDRCARC